MPRYIDVDKAIENIRSGDGTSMQKLFAECCVLAVPAADVVEVLRCKDCKYGRSRQSSKLGFVWCAKWGNFLTACDFCSCGKLTYKRFIEELGNTGNVSDDDLYAMYEAYLNDSATE